MNRKAELNELFQTKYSGYWNNTFISCSTGFDCEFAVDSIVSLRFFCFLILNFKGGGGLLFKGDEINDKFRILHEKPSNVLRNSHADNKGIVLLLMTF